MWEIAAEVEPPAINDLMATTLGGIALGEVTHRMSLWYWTTPSVVSHVSPASFWEP